MTCLIDQENLVSSDEIASKIGVKPDTITMWARIGRVPSFRISKRVIRFSLPAVMSALGLAVSTERPGFSQSEVKP
jgi:hypothetical protein